jgi:hypothetical protein
LIFEKPLDFLTKNPVLCSWGSRPRSTAPTLLACPLNAGKLQSVAALLACMRACAEREAKLQWGLFC